MDQDAPFRGRAPQPSLARLREAAHVLAQVDGARAGLDGNAEYLRDRAPAADDETAATRQERAPEVGQRLEQERDAVRRTEVGEQLVVEDEDRYDVRRLPHRGV